MTDARFGTDRCDMPDEMLNTYKVISKARIKIIGTNIDFEVTRSGSNTGRVCRAL